MPPKLKVGNTIEGGYSAAPCGVRWSKPTEKACMLALRLHKKTCIVCREQFNDSVSEEFPLLSIDNRHTKQNKEYLTDKAINRTLLELSTVS